MTNIIWRHGDVLIEKVDSIPKGLQQKQNSVLLEGETSGHFHTLSNAKVFLADAAPTKENDYLIGYFETEEGALLTHQEHQTIELPKGIYKFHCQREYDPQAERKVID